jgi:hypothetical protein
MTAPKVEKCKAGPASMHCPSIQVRKGGKMKLIKKRWLDETGQMIVLTLLCMTILTGFLALAIDVGIMFRARRQMQTAADSAALAAALDFLYNQSNSSAVTAGKAASATNGYTDGNNGTVVKINMPPKSGPNTTCNSCAEAIVSQPNSTVFMSTFSSMFGGGNFSSLTVAARGVAGTPGAGAACIWLMSPTGTGLQVQGAYDIEAPNCGIYVNSTSNDAIDVTGNGGTINAAFLDIVGNSPPKHETNPTVATINSAARTLPWGNLAGPDPTTSCGAATGGNTIVSNTVTQAQVNAAVPSNGVVCIKPASGNNITLSGGLNLPGSSSGIVYLFDNTGNVSIGVGSAVTFGSGTYDSTSGTFTNTSGAMMDLYAGTLSQASNNLLNIYAPTSGAYDGIALFQPTSNTNELQVQKGSNNQVLDGYIFAPGAEVYLQDHGGGITTSGIVASYLYDKSSTITIGSYDTANQSTTLNRQLTLIE